MLAGLLFAVYVMVRMWLWWAMGDGSMPGFLALLPYPLIFIVAIPFGWRAGLSMAVVLVAFHAVVYAGASNRGGHAIGVRIVFQLFLIGTAFIAGYISDLNRRLRGAILTQRQTELELQHKMDEIEALASTDFLTGLANRRHFHDVARPLFEHARRTGDALSVILLDLDLFKEINDAHGHSAGDQVLIQVAAQLSASCTNACVLARFGGEEFILVLPNVSLKNAQSIAETLREDVEELEITFLDDTLPVTASFGVATLEAHDPTIDRLISRADKALYQAKALGRNRICAAHPQIAT